jgi:hypothetical protein
LFIVVSSVALFAASTGSGRAADACIVKPNAEPPQGQHWYYRTNRETNRQCWYLGSDGAASRNITTEAVKPDAPPTAGVSANMSREQREALFRKYVEWQQNRRAQAAQ